MKESSYVLVTPARNEAQYLPGVIDSVVSQKRRPLYWIIISDGSTDGTNEIAERAASLHRFIRFVSGQGSSQRSFGSKARAFQSAAEYLAGFNYSYIGNLDADITLAPNYYAEIIARMEADSRLGVSSGVCWDKSEAGFKRVTISLNHAVGAVQMFRRECFQQIGGYRPTTVGGVDSLAELTARMKGWKTRAFPDLPVYHHKPVDSASARSPSQIRYRAGLTEYHIGTHPLFATAKALRRWRESPPVVSVVIRMSAYMRLWLSNAPRDAPPELVNYLKKEQLKLLRNRIAGRQGG